MKSSDIQIDEDKDMDMETNTQSDRVREIDTDMAIGTDIRRQ
jgi:hypothetical protein